MVPIVIAAPSSCHPARLSQCQRPPVLVPQCHPLGLGQCPCSLRLSLLSPSLGHNPLPTHLACWLLVRFARLAGELFTLALLVGKQGGSLGLRSTLAPRLTRWSRERGRLRRAFDDLRRLPGPPRQIALNRRDRVHNLVLGHRFDAALRLDLHFLWHKQNQKLKENSGLVLHFFLNGMATTEIEGPMHFQDRGLVQRLTRSLRTAARVSYPPSRSASRFLGGRPERERP